MKRNVMRKNLLQTIRRSIGRYIAIVAIIALGSGMFVGLVTTKSDMIATAQEYTLEQNMFHLRLLNTYGWSDCELEKIEEMNGVSAAEGSITLDVIAQFGEEEEDKVYRLHSLPRNVNKVYLLGGRLPQHEDECLADGSHADDSILGTQVTISEDNSQDTLDSLTQKTFTVVGYVSTPIYMDITRGTTTIGNGSLNSYLYIPPETFNVDYYTEINVVLEGNHEIYSQQLTQMMEDAAQQLEPQLTHLIQERYISLKAEAQQEYADGLSQYEQGLEEYQNREAEAQKELADADQKLNDTEAELEENQTMLQQAQTQIIEAQETLDQSASELNTAQRELSDAKAQAYQQLADAYDELMINYKTALEGQKQLEDGLKQIDDGIAQLEAGLDQAKSGLEQLAIVTGILETSIDVTERLIEAEEQSLIINLDRIQKLQAQLVQQQEKLGEYNAQKEQILLAQAEYTPQLEELKNQRSTLLKEKETVDAAVSQIELGFKELEATQVQTDNRFASAQAQIDSGLLQLEEGQKQLDKQAEQLAQGMLELEAGQKALEDGWKEYEKGKEQVQTQLADAQSELDEAKGKLDEAKDAISQMGEPELFVLDRNSNPGYLAVNSNSDIVEGVSKVFPAFFLLIAALVCITTLTKMVDEERTQIGILKALGYKNSSIIGKYLLYCSSAAVIGCSLGATAGSVIFPKILWSAYSIILCIRPDIVLKLDVPLCLAVVVAYTVVSMAVTWLCCRRELREVPAQLIRPKAPAAGKKIWMEHLPFWNRIGFLNKVMFRNVFRYRKRLLMMMVGIGGCSALLLTGFGIGDSIGDIVEYQFAEVMVYDMEVYFSGGQAPQEQASFRDELRSYIDQAVFYHRTSVELEYENQKKEVSMIASEEALHPYLNLHDGDERLEMPGVGEILLTFGAAEDLGLDVGDEVILRNSDMKSLSVSVAGVFDNHVTNYLIIDPQTITQQWGIVPEQQMAMINIRDNQDVHAAGAEIAAMDDVMAVSISQDVAEQVGGMLEALNLVVVTVVICAALLAMIVLYNLTNINISERIREIATIKVLGFYPKEAAAYVFKENLLLSAMGAVVGLGGGIFLLKFVMSQIKIDMVWFQDRLTFSSYLWSLLLTILSACLVDFFLYFKLEKVNMAEALKSVE